MKETDQTLSEVVGTGYAIPGKSKSITTGESKKRSVDLTKRNELSAFAAYVQKQIDSLKAAGAYNFTPQQIQLSFTINKHGKPTHIKVTDKSSAEVFELAKRLLQNGPSWTRTSGNKKSTITIQL